jgi:trans-2,3-dihydro-3-hydroxyanthranilate isomerase
MGRPSRLELEADKKDGAITAIRVGGSTVVMTRGTMRVPEPAEGTNARSRP